MKIDYNRKPRTNNEINKFVERVKESTWPESKKKRFADYMVYLRASGKAERTIALYSRHVFLFGDFLPKKAFEGYTEQDTQAFKLRMENRFSPYNVHNQMLDCITFTKWLLKTKDKPQNFLWYDVSAQNKKVAVKLRKEDVLTPDEVQKLVSCAGSVRNKALVSCLWETGCRIEEFLNSRVGDASFQEKIITLTIRRGKTREAEREVFLIESAPSFMSWWREHAFKGDQKAFLFYGVGKSNKGNRLYGTNVCSILKRSAKKAGVTKPVSPHKLRHSRATFLSGKRHSDQVMRQIFGWSENSPMPSHYSHLSSLDVQKALMQDSGLIPVVEGSGGMRLRACPFCSTANPVDALVCEKCFRPITVEGVKAEEAKQKELMKTLLGELEERILTKIKGKTPITKG